MWAAPSFLVYLVFVIAGTAIAVHLVYRPRPSAERLPKPVRQAIVILIGWIGVFGVAALSRTIADWMLGRITYGIEGMDIFDVLYSETHDERIANVATGWIWGVAFLIIGRALASSGADRTNEIEQVVDDQSATAVPPKAE